VKDYNGNDQFVYQVCDNGTPTACDKATVYISLAPVNDPPIAVADTVTTPENIPISGNVLTNDTDVDGDALTVTGFTVQGVTYTTGTLVTIPNVGKIVVNTNGSFTFTPVLYYNGTIPTVGYSISDGNGGTAASTLTIIVTPVNNSPTALPDVATTPEDTQLAGNVLTNDSDVDGNTLTVTGITVQGVSYTTGTLVTIPNIGKIVVNTNGSYTFTPAANYNGTVPTVDYAISDGNGGTATSTLNITVTPVNDPPTAINDINSTFINKPVNGNVLTNDTDPENDPLTVTTTPITVPTNGTVTLKPDGSYTYTPNAGFTGTDSFTYEVCDNATPKLCDQATVTITVMPVPGPTNNSPVATDDAYQGSINTPVKGNVLTNDFDVDGNLNPTSVKLAGSPPSNGTLTLNTDGTFTFVPTTGFIGQVNFEYQICDTGTPVLCDVAKVTIDIEANPTGNSTFATDDSYIVKEDVTLTGNVLSNDYDPQGNTQSVNTIPVSTTTHGKVTLNANGSFTYVPDANYNGPDSFIYQLCDNGTPTACAKATAYISVSPVNDAPIAVADTVRTPEDTPISGNVLTNDTDVDGDALTVTGFTVQGVTYPTGTLVTIPNVGKIVVNTNGSFTFTPALNYNGTVAPVGYSISDGNGGTASSTLTIIVTPVNDAPVAMPDVATTPEDTQLTGNVLTNDTDVDGNTLTVTAITVQGVIYPTGTLVTIPNIGTIVVNTNGSYTFTPSTNYNGPVPTVDYAISDGNGGTAASTLDITVTPVNDPPTAINDINSTFINKPVDGNVLTNDTDPENDPLTVTTTPVIAPKNGTIVLKPDGSYTYTPNTGFIGTDSLTYEVCDNGTPKLCAQATVTIIVMPVPGPTNNSPVATDDVYQGSVNTTIKGNVLSNDFDVDGNLDPTSVKFAGNPPTNGILNLNTDGTFTFVPTTGFIGQVTFEYQICDTGTPVLCDIGKVTINIEANPTGNSTFATDDSYIVKEDVTLTGNVLTNDYDPQGDTQIVNTIPVSTTTHGKLTINANGSFTYIPNANYNGPDSFVYQLCDNGTPTACAKATAYISISPVNDAPIAVADTVRTPEDTPVSGNVLTNDTDVDGDALTVTGFTVLGVTYAPGNLVTMPNVGTIVVNTNGSFTFTPVLYYNGAVPTVGYSISDGNGGTAASTLTIIITPLNHTPTAIPDVATIPEDTPLTGNVVTNDIDVDGNTLTVTGITVQGVTYPAGTLVAIPNVGTIVVNANGSYTYTPAANYNGTVPTVGYTISDGNGGTATSTLDITVTPVADPPLARSETVTVTQNGSTVILVLKNDDFGPDGPSVGSITASNGTHGTVTVNNNGTPNDPTDDKVVYTPDPSYIGTDTFTYTICSANGLCSTATDTVKVIALSNYLLVNKRSTKVTQNSDGTFSWKYIIMLTNKQSTKIDSIHVADDLNAVFINGETFKVMGIIASGNLISNGLYNGASDINTLSLTKESSLAANSKDSIVIEVRVDSHRYIGEVYNQAVFEGTPVPTGKVTNVLSDDPSNKTPGVVYPRPTITLIPEPGLFIPDAFSPNNDGFNDKFVIIHSHLLKIKIEVFNRWGNRVYSSNDYQNDWDGKGVDTFLGQVLPNGTYYYIVESTNTDTNESTNQAGYVTLKR
jgi:gliding motility-associated-like protein